MTSPRERVVRDGWENRVPRTPDDFAQVWKNSTERAALVKEIEKYNQTYTPGGEYLQKFKDSRRIQQSKHQRVGSPYTLSYAGQVKLCLRRGFWRLKGDPTLTLSQLFGNSMMALIISSIFYNLPQTTTSFYSRSALLFFAVLLNAFGSALEVCTRSVHRIYADFSDSHTLCSTSNCRKTREIRSVPSVL
jgi:ATP-binding cassette subfamily G (WHITE) protein 2 (PDR)